ncbi:formyl transferase [delta proteobacterium NaphS2]|nr:formyl transferase [delta proteobacterium NaphS2]
MILKPVFDPEKQGRPMRVAAFMSGSGTNIRRLLEHETSLKKRNEQPPFKTVFIFSDRADGTSSGEKIALDYGLPYFSYDIRVFHEKRGLRRTVRNEAGLSARATYDRLPEKLIKGFEVDVVALGGYMSYTTLKGCVNVHPADLSIVTGHGHRRYVGDHAVRDAILAGEETLRSSTLWTDEGVDTGPLLMVSEPLPVILPEPLEAMKKHPEKLASIIDAHQERLKEVGDWKIFPRTIELIARGRFSFDPGKGVYLDGLPVPRGYREQ